MEYYVIYHVETGQIITTGQGPAGCASLQQLEDGMATMVVPRQAIQALGGVNLDVIRISYTASIDADADKVRSMFITNTPGQMQTYMEKEVEARRVLAGDSAPTLFLALEAAAIGSTIEVLAAEVVAQADHWRPIGARIEAARRKAKVDVATADNLAAIADAIRIDWSAIVALTA